MPRYFRKQIFCLGSFPEAGQKQKTEREKRKKEDQKLVITMVTGQLRIAMPPRVAHAKPPGPIFLCFSCLWP